MPKVEIRQDGTDRWLASAFEVDFFLQGLERNQGGFGMHYRIVDDNGTVLRLFKLDGRRLVEVK